MDNQVFEAITLKQMGTLDVSAASGLLFLNNNFYVIADDEVCLSIYSSDLRKIKQIQLLKNDLPIEYKARKALKPDFESLVYISKTGAILVLPSGSKPNRSEGALLIDDKVEKINFTKLYQFLLELNPELNIEGAVTTANELKIFSRGNGPSGKNFMINLNIGLLIDEIKNQNSLTEKTFINQIQCDFGKMNGFNLGITDAALETSGRVWYIAVAESSVSTYDDGSFEGAVIGCMDENAKIIFQRQLIVPSKPEGLALDLVRKKFYVVTDADNRSQLAQLFVGEIN